MLEKALAMNAVVDIRGQEHHSHPILAWFRQRQVQLFAFLGKEAMGHLDQDSRPVAGVALASARSAMLEIQQYLKPLFDYPVGFTAQHVYDEADTAGIVFIPRVI
jgi:hypothetical protein